MFNDPQQAKLFGSKTKIEELNIPSAILTDLLFRLLFNEGDVNFSRFVDVIRVHQSIIDEILSWMQTEHLVEVAKAGQLGRYSYTYRLTEAGEDRARSALERSQYLGPAPVSIEEYCTAIEAQTKNQQIRVSPPMLQQSLSHLILPENFDRRVGPALNSGTSLFLYGPPGNGKTTIAQVIGMLLAGAATIRIPYAVVVGGSIVKIHDRLIHVDAQGPTKDSGSLRQVDDRWGVFRKPVVMVGGELNMESLDLRYDPVAKFYEAPLQMKANGGMFLIDDFGRQQMKPQELLNRWIVPLESGIDFFRLLSGQTFEVPFRQLIVFSTNLDPSDLVDDAFLRRIQMKVEVPSPSEKMFYQIFLQMCKMYSIEFNRESFVYLVENWYRKSGRKMQSVHPRDLLRTIVSICEYSSTKPHLSPSLIDEACQSYFVDSGSES